MNTYTFDPINMGRSFEFYYVLFYHTCKLIIIEINLFAKNTLKFKCNKSRFHSNYCYMNYYVQLELSDVTRYNLQCGWLHQCLLDTIIRGCICSSGLVQQNFNIHLWHIFSQGSLSTNLHLPKTDNFTKSTKNIPTNIDESSVCRTAMR